jgi:hypothetical protein
MVNYPGALPNDALMVMLDKVRGKDVSIAELCHAAWNVQGYAQGQFIGGGQAIGASTEVQTVSDEELLKSALEQDADAKGFGVVPWVLLAKLAIRLVLASL